MELEKFYIAIRFERTMFSSNPSPLEWALIDGYTLGDWAIAQPPYTEKEWWSGWWYIYNKRTGMKLTKLGFPLKRDAETALLMVVERFGLNHNGIPTPDQQPIFDQWLRDVASLGLLPGLLPTTDQNCQ